MCGRAWRRGVSQGTRLCVRWGIMERSLEPVEEMHLEVFPTEEWATAFKNRDV